MKVSTKVNKAAKAIVTNLTVVWDDSQAERALALQALVVKLQGTWRKNGIPSEASVKLSDYAPGTRHASEPMTPSAIAARAKADPEFMKQVLAELNLEVAE